jgi:hypothetical protein
MMENAKGSKFGKVGEEAKTLKTEVKTLKTLLKIAVQDEGKKCFRAAC